MILPTFSLQQQKNTLPIWGSVQARSRRTRFPSPLLSPPPLVRPRHPFFYPALVLQISRTPPHSPAAPTPAAPLPAPSRHPEASISPQPLPSPPLPPDILHRLDLARHLEGAAQPAALQDRLLTALSRPVFHEDGTHLGTAGHLLLDDLAGGGSGGGASASAASGGSEGGAGAASAGGVPWLHRAQVMFHMVDVEGRGEVDAGECVALARAFLTGRSGAAGGALGEYLADLSAVGAGVVEEAARAEAASMMEFAEGGVLTLRGFSFWLARFMEGLEEEGLEAAAAEEEGGGTVAEGAAAPGAPAAAASPAQAPLEGGPDGLPEVAVSTPPAPPAVSLGVGAVGEGEEGEGAMDDSGSVVEELYGKSPAPSDLSVEEERAHAFARESAAQLAAQWAASQAGAVAEGGGACGRAPWRVRVQLQRARAPWRWLPPPSPAHAVI